MKTAISVEDSLMAEADAAAKDLGLSRSGLIAEALREYLRCRRQNLLAEQLNQAYAIADAPGDRQLVREAQDEDADFGSLVASSGARDSSGRHYWLDFGPSSGSPRL